MKKLSSKSTFYSKRVFPVIWFGGLIFIATKPLLAGNANGFNLFFIFVFMAVGYFLMKKSFFDLIDEVYDEGNSLLFKKSGAEARVSLRDIEYVSYETVTRNPRVRLNLRYESDLGKELVFLPPISFLPFKKSRDIEELIDRINRARG